MFEHATTPAFEQMFVARLCELLRGTFLVIGQVPVFPGPILKFFA
jgi:hypothetical protein